MIALDEILESAMEEEDDFDTMTDEDEELLVQFVDPDLDKEEGCEEDTEEYEEEYEEETEEN